MDEGRGSLSKTTGPQSSFLWDAAPGISLENIQGPGAADSVVSPDSDIGYAGPKKGVSSLSREMEECLGPRLRAESAFAPVFIRSGDLALHLYLAAVPGDRTVFPLAPDYTCFPGF